MMLKTPRLLPVVIAAASALLLFKGIGLVTNGGYVLTGTVQAVAAGASGGHGGSTPVAKSADPTIALPHEATITDTSPTLEDNAPVLPLAEEQAEQHGEAARAVEEVVAKSQATPPASGPNAFRAACPPAKAEDADAEGHGAEAPKAGAGHAPELAEPAAGTPDCLPIPLNEHGDAIALQLNEKGQLAPVTADDGSEEELLGRLGERRTSLDAREKELEMRLALVEAAEKRLEERSAALQAVEARINALVDQKKADEEKQFSDIVQMYEMMKPKEAATILNTLDNSVLVRVARAMNPRKMAPILARMDPMKARTLTSSLAREPVEPSLDAATVEDLSSLPQIVGQ